MQASMIAALSVGFVVSICLAGQAEIADSPDCMSKARVVNVCDLAKNIEAQLSSHLPIKMNQDMQMTSVVAIEKRILILANWFMTKDEFQNRLTQNQTTIDELRQKMDAATKESVCSSSVSRAFVDLGGELQYNYQTSDGYNFASPVVSMCGE